MMQKWKKKNSNTKENMLKEDRGNYVDRNDHDRDGKDNDKEDDGEQDDGDDKVDANLAITPLSSLLIFLNSFSASLILNYPTSENWLQWEKKIFYFWSWVHFLRSVGLIKNLGPKAAR